MKNIYEWNNEYALYHKNKTNKAIHWICIPLIMFSLFGLLSLIKPLYTFMINEGTYKITILGLFIILTILYYLKLSKSLAIGMLLISAIFIFIIDAISSFDKNQLLLIYISIFIIAWIGQFLGHKIEGKKPAFFKDLQFLLIGPLWLLSFIYNKLNIKI